MAAAPRISPTELFSPGDWAPFREKSAWKGPSLAAVWRAYFALWLLPMATWFPLVTRLRNIAEHACVENSATDPFRAARTTRAAWWERAFIAPYWVNFHAEHHLFMHVRCDRLPALHRALVEKGHGDRMEIAPGYLSVLREATARKRTL
ncbi:fatty acid desaturase [Brevundimonas subvibrioides]|uniref:fatty acid desaturase n=1 Tax=Brevundimonas subvibrioides TaxID=74313 RepID=UPI0001BDD28F|nr:fatty acid desaturase [Brevundimonas subvibrioides]